MIEIGLRGMQKTIVDDKNTAQKMGSGDLPVFATPAMIALMEKTAAYSVAPELDDSCSTVGIKIDVSHTAASSIGTEISCESELINIDGKKLTFTVIARDSSGIIGEGKHERFIVDREKFMKRTLEKGN